MIMDYASMSTWIYGYMEAARGDDAGDLCWFAHEKLRVIGWYDLFGCLFGVRNYANYRPVAPDRGIPLDASDAVKQAVAQQQRWAGSDSLAFHSPTWISWSEIKRIDWAEEALEADSRLHRYQRTEDGTLVYEGKSSWSGRLVAATGISFEDALLNKWIWREGFEMEAGQRVYRAEKLQRKDALSPEWLNVFETMESLAAEYGDEQVRLVVWFAD
jgi:hypothetical protein